MQKLPLPLYPIPSKEWENTYNRLIKDPYVITKYNRDTRLNEQLNYIDTYLPEIYAGNSKILDLGPGPGEFLEYCRYFKNNIWGIDAKSDDCEMGTEYLQLSWLLAERQKIPVEYFGLENYVNNKGINPGLPFEDNSVSIINSQGSWEQMLKEYLIGRPHREHKNCNLLSWDISNYNLKEFLIKTFKEFDRILVNGGIILIYGNGAQNQKEYDFIFRDILHTEFKHFEIMFTKDNRLYKIRKR